MNGHGEDIHSGMLKTGRHYLMQTPGTRTCYSKTFTGIFL